MGVLDLTKKNAFVFPGQGAQGAGMGKDLADNFPAAKEIFDKADEILGFSLSDLCFNGPDADLNITVNTQPALYVTSAAAWKAADSMGIKAVCAAGHSVGEYVALCAAGAFTFEEGLRLIRKRAEFMNKYAELRPGSMAAVLGLAPEKVAEIAAEARVAGMVTAANFNSPIQTVISGEKDAVAKACELAKAAGARRALPLKVSGGFHSALMDGAAEEMAAFVAEADIKDAAIPVFANFTAKAETKADESRENLIKQIIGNVRWVESVEAMVGFGVENFIELGSGAVLAGLIKRIAPDAGIASAGTKDSLEAL